MMKLDSKSTTVFALVKDSTVFVGRTVNPHVSAVVYDHCSGKHLCTKDHFDLKSNRPTLSILERVAVPSPMAYRHQLAWMYRFIEAGYEVLGSQETVDRAKEPHPFTQSILNEITKEPLETVLEKGKCLRFADGDIVIPDTNPSQPEKLYDTASEMLSIRMTPAEKERYDRYANTLGMTRRDLLQYLVTQDRSLKHMDLDTNMLEVRQAHSLKRDKMNHQIEGLKEDLSKARSSKTDIQHRHTTEHKLLQLALRNYLDCFVPSSKIPLSIEEGYYREYMDRTEVSYAYPNAEGHAIMRPVAVLEGHNHAHFIVGATTSGEDIKLRFYPGKFLGIAPYNRKYGLRSSNWLIAWRHAEEDVMEIILALPLDVKPARS